MFKIIPTLLLLLFFNSYGQSGLPSRWSSTSAYPAGDLVISNGSTYLALRAVPSGTPLTSNLFWVSLDTQVPSSSSTPDLPRDANGDVVTPDVTEVAYLSTPNSTRNFYHGFKHLDQTGADKYLIEQSGIKKYSEWQNPPLTYLGPSANNKPSTLTYKYSFEGAVQSAKVRISLSAWNFNAPGAYGSGSGQASAWASKDGTNWKRILDLPTPSTFSAGKTFEEYLPTSVLGSNELYLQIRMEVSGAPNTSYTTAQFGRSDANANKDIFYLDANYSSSKENAFNPIPLRPNTFSLQSFQAGSTTDIDNIKVTNLDTEEVVYQNSFSTQEDLTHDLILHYYPTGGSDDYEENSTKTRLVDNKLRLETTGFNSNGSGGYDSITEAKYSGTLPENFLIEFDAERLQWAGHFHFMVYFEDPSDALASYETGGTWNADRSSQKDILILRMAGSGSWFQDNKVEIKSPTEENSQPFVFTAPSGSLLEQHRLGISLEGNIVKFFLNGSLLNTADVSDYLMETFDSSDGLVAYFPFDGNASDMSGKGNDGTVYGATLSTDRNGDANKAYSFDGVNDYIKVGGTSSLTNGENQTISVWVKGTDIGNPIYWDDDTQNGGDTKISIHDGSVIRFKRTGNVVLYTTDTVDMTKWNHIVVSFKDDTTYKIYINGSLSLKEDLEDNLDLDNRTHISIGSGHNGFQGYFNGSIDEVRHYTRTLSDIEVKALYELEKPKYPSSSSFFDIDAQSQSNEVTYSAPKSSYYEVALNSLPDARFDVVSYWSPAKQWMSGFQYSINSGTAVDHRFGPFPTKEEAFLSFENLVLFLDEGQVVTFSDPDNSVFDNSGGTSIVIYPIEINNTFDPSEGLVAYFPFDGNASDMSGNGNDGTVYGATLGEDRYGQLSKAYSFDGTEDYIDVDYSSSINTASYTISAWVKPKTIMSERTQHQKVASVITSRDDSPIQGYMLYQYSDDRWHSQSGGTSWWYSTYGLDVDLNKWISLTMTHSSQEGATRLYENGVQVGVSNETFVANTSKPFRIGGGATESSTPKYFFPGSIDDIRIYNRALLDIEVKALYELEKPREIDLTSDLIAYFPFDGNASDMSGNGSDGTVYGATLGTDRHGQAQMSYEFDGTNDWIGLSQQIPDLENFTLSAWFNGKGSIFQDETESSGNDFGIFFHGSDGTFKIRNTKGGSSFNESYDPADYINENWNQVVFSLSSDKVIVAFNGNKIEYDGTYTGNVGYHSSVPRIGTYNYFGNSNFFDGLIDDIRLYSRALSSDEISALYELEKPRFNMAECMQHLPVGSLIAIPAGANAPSGLSLVQQGQSDGFDLYKVDGPIPVNDSFAVGASEVIKNPSKFGLFTQEDLNSTQDAAKKEGENIGKSLGEYSVINNPAVYGLFSQSAYNQAIADINTSAHASGVISGRESVLADPTGHNLIGLSAHTQAIADINTSAHSSGVISGRESVLIDPYSYNLISRIEYDQMAKSLRMPDTNATPYTDGWFYIPDHGWLWTINQAYPWFYDANSSDWLYFKQGGSQPRFYEYASKKWVEWADFVKQPWDSHYEGWLKNPEPYGGANVLGLIKKAKNEQKTKLDLGDYHVKDLAPLSGLKHLTALNIGDNDITDISVLSQMNGLTRLVLKDNKNLVDLHPLADLSNLEELDLMYNDLSQLDLTPLYQLSNLRILRVSDYLVSFSQMNALQEKLPNSQILFVEGEDFDWSN